MDISNKQASYAVAIALPKTFNKRYVFSVKGCISWKKMYSLSRDISTNQWTMYSLDKESDEKYNFFVNDIEHLYNICAKLGMIDFPYKVTLQNSNMNNISSHKFENLRESIQWCFDTDMELEHVSVRKKS